jgi:6-pyruvoyltetrahydropterin/6-carboxytetrahydropterin synthase
MSTMPANKLRLTRRYRFSSTHRLYSDELSEQDNRATFGKCANPYGHGHDYVLHVSVIGPLEPETGRIVDLDTLDGLVRDTVVRPFEHANLNVDVPEFAGTALVPTTENLAIVIQQRLEAEWTRRFQGDSSLSHAALGKIKIEETKRNIFEVSGAN